jgi:hypothetical protein
MDSIWTPNTGLPIIIVKKGDNMASLTGIMTYGFNNFKLLPRNNADFEAYQSINSIGSSFVNKGKALVYPNPTSSVMNLDYIMPVNTSDLTLKIYDIFGRTINVVSLDGTTGTANVNVSEYAQGTYIYSISSASAGVLNNGRFVVTK